jgi:hypothetical protein
MSKHFGGRFQLTRGRTAMLAGVLAAVLVPVLIAGASASTHRVKNPICNQLTKIGVSAGAYNYCKGPFKPQSGSPRAGTINRTAKGLPNVNAASVAEDVSPANVRGYGQSEESTAAVGRYVVEAWNDSTGFFTNCGAPQYKEELTGYGFSNNRGKSFHDQGGLPNIDCSKGWFYEGDPSVVGWSSGGATYFYISSLYVNFNTGQSDIALDVCTVSGSGTSASLSCNAQPTIVAGGGFQLICGPYGCFRIPKSFLDKDYLTLDPVRGRLYATFTRFNFSANGANGQVELAACDISGAAAANPVCSPGRSSRPYYLVQAGDPNCENEGAYPAVSRKTGDVYVAWEYNWATNIFNPPCFNTPTQERLAYVPSSCLTLPSTTCRGATEPQTSLIVNSMDSAFIPGYNRFPMNDFPRIAVSDTAGTVSIVYNDAGRHAAGDILMQSYHLLSSTSTGFGAVQHRPLRLNNNRGSTWTFMPALRNADRAGLLDVAWYDRRKSNPSCEACTDVYAAIHVSPTATTTPKTNVRITNVSSNWNAVSSDIIPNFGDYIDDIVVGKVLYIAWADGRLGVPQPFNAHTGG